MNYFFDKLFWKFSLRKHVPFCLMYVYFTAAQIFISVSTRKSFERENWFKMEITLSPNFYYTSYLRLFYMDPSYWTAISYLLIRICYMMYWQYYSLILSSKYPVNTPKSLRKINIHIFFIYLFYLTVYTFCLFLIYWRRRFS